MRIPYPERIPIDRVAIFAVLLFIIQSVEGTPLYFSGGCVAFIVIAGMAFNAAGGLTSASGAYVFFYALLSLIVGLCYKALLGEPADTNLSDPHSTIAVFVGGITAMFAAVTISRRLSRKQGLLQNVLKESEMYRSCVGCIVFGIVGGLLISLIDSNNTLNRAFTQLNQLLPMAIIIGVMYEIRRSGGRRSMNLPVAFAIFYSFVFLGLLSFSKQGMLQPLYCWAVPVCAMRFRLTALQLASCMLGIFLLFHYLVPYSQYGRRFIVDNPSNSVRVEIALRLLKDPEDTRQRYLETIETGNVGAHYYNTPQGFWDRLNFIAVDDSLINITDQGRHFGFSPIWASFVNAVPHFILPNKPTLNFGNTYAHEIGGLPDDDTTTGISFTPSGEAYHLGQWIGIFVAVPIILVMTFVILDSLLGDIRATPWGLLALALISHQAPEGGITGAIYLFTFGAAIFIFGAFFATWVAPSFAIAILGRDRSRIQRQTSFEPALAPRLPN